MTSKPLKILSHFTLTFICFYVSLVTSSRSKAHQPLSVAVFAHARVWEKQTGITLLSAWSLSSSQLVVWSNHPLTCCCLAPEGSHAPFLVDRKSGTSPTSAPSKSPNTRRTATETDTETSARVGAQSERSAECACLTADTWCSNCLLSHLSAVDHSRVKLENTENDYINASLVVVEEAQRRYILTQASIPKITSQIASLVKLTAKCDCRFFLPVCLAFV